MPVIPHHACKVILPGPTGRGQGSSAFGISPVLLPGKSHGWSSLVRSVHGVAEGQTWLSDCTFTFHFHALEKEMATHSSVLAWRIPGTGEPGGLLSMGSHRVGHDWSDLAVSSMCFSPWLIFISFIPCHKLYPWVTTVSFVSLSSKLPKLRVIL